VILILIPLLVYDIFHWTVIQTKITSYRLIGKELIRFFKEGGALML